MARETKHRSLRWSFIVVGFVVLVGYGVVDRLIISPMASIRDWITPPSIPLIERGPLVLNTLQQHARLETASMKLSQKQKQTLPHGLFNACEESITYEWFVTVSAGIDLGKLTPESVIVHNDGFPEVAHVTIHVPKAAIFHAELDTQHSAILEENEPFWSAFCSDNTAELVTGLQKSVPLEAVEGAVAGGILQYAENNAGTVLQHLLWTVGYKNVTIVYSDGSQRAPLEKMPAHIPPTPVPSIRLPDTTTTDH